MDKFFGIFNDIEKDPIYDRLFKVPFSYVAGAVFLGILNTLRLASLGGQWGVSGAFGAWTGSIFGLFGWNPDWGVALPEDGGFFASPVAVQNIGIIAGALLAALLASQFKIKKIKSKKQVIAAVLGGFMMGFGARIAGGCNVGALFSSISQLNLSGWVFGLFLLGGAWIGSKLLLKFFL